MSIPANDLEDLSTHASRRSGAFTAPRLVSDLMPPLDGLLVFLAAQISTWICGRWPSGAAWDKEAIPGSSTAIIVAILAAFILYDRRFGASARKLRIAPVLQRHAPRFVLLVAAAIATSVLGAPPLRDSLLWLAIWLGAALLLTSLVRILAAGYLSRIQQLGPRVTSIAVVGTGPLSDRLVEALQENGTTELVGVFDDIPAAHAGAGHVGTVTDLLALGKIRRIDWILLATAQDEERHLLPMVQRLKALEVPIGLCPQHIGLDVPFHSIDLVDGRLPVSLLVHRPIRRWDAVAKAAEDFIGAAIITALLLPVLAGIALAVRLSGPGPIIFRQRRHTLNNREFDVYKFRTMHWSPASASGNLQQTTRMDSRVTRVGRFLRASSLDELPQLFNVLKGEMSLVGPRPHAVNMRTESRLGPEITEFYAHRHRVKPGMTGWSQVNGARGATETMEQLRRRVELDVYYIENWSVLLDIWIITLTVRAVMRQTNAY